MFSVLVHWSRVFQFFNYVSYFIGGEVFTLQDIENGVLRGNRKGVAQLLKPFSRNDPRLQVFQQEEVNFVLTPGIYYIISFLMGIYGSMKNLQHPWDLSCFISSIFLVEKDFLDY